MIRDAAAALRPKGVLYLSTMEDDPEKSGFKPSSSGKGEAAYIQFYRAEFLADALYASGFTWLDLSRKVYTGRNGEIVSDVLIVAKK